jgi:hypothetical protein
LKYTSAALGGCGFIWREALAEMRAHKKSDEMKVEPPIASPVPAAAFAAAIATAGGVSGAAAGSLAGPIGAVVGATTGALVGGIGGMMLGRVFDPRSEDEYWREQHFRQTYAKPDDSFNDFLAAYQSGYETHFVAAEKPEFDDEIAHARYVARGGHLEWSLVRPAALAAWQRVRGIDPEAGTTAKTKSLAVSPSQS